MNKNSFFLIKQMKALVSRLFSKMYYYNYHKNYFNSLLINKNKFKKKYFSSFFKLGLLSNRLSLVD